MRGGRASCLALAGALALSAGLAQAQSTTTNKVKSFEIVSVEGNTVVTREADGTHEYTLPSDFRVTVGGKQVSLQELQPGMKGKATITTTTTVKPVHVTEVKSGEVVKTVGSSVIIRGPDGYKMFTQGDMEKRGIRIYKGGQPVRLEDLRAGDKLSATIVTEGEPQVLTEKQVQATISAPPTPAATPAAAAGTPAAPADGSARTAAATTGPASAGTAGGSTPWLPWGAGIILAVVVILFLVRRSAS